MKIRILHAVNVVNKADGIARVIESLAISTDKQYEIYVSAKTGSKLSEFRDSKNFIPVYFSLKKYDVLSFLLNFGYYFFVIKTKNISIFHSHHRYFDFMGLFLAKITGVINISSVHSYLANFTYLSFKGNNLIACSKSVRNHLVQVNKVPQTKVTVIYNFIQETLYSPSQIRSESANLFRFVHLGKLDFSVKKADIVFESFKILKKKRNDFEVFVYGEGIDYKKLEELCVDEENFKIFKPSQEVSTIYEFSSCVLLPSRIDPFPLVMLEAGYFGKPFIGGNTGGIAELIEHGKTGLLVEPGNAEDLANAMLYVLEHREEADMMGKEFQKVIKSRFLAEHIIPQYELYYNNLLNN